MRRCIVAGLALAGALIWSGCAAPVAEEVTPVATAGPAAAATGRSTDQPEPAATPPGEPTVSATATASPIAPTAAAPAAAATRVGADYVLRLPREAAVPNDWAMNPLPDFETRTPSPGDTYRFACRDLPARSVGVASVGYRQLEGQPSVFIEYVVYPSAGEAAAALADMGAAIDACPEFTIGAGAGETAATFTSLDFPDYGEESLAVALLTDNPQTGPLITHVIKIRQGHVVIGISHANDAAVPPDTALTAALAELTVANLRDGPPAPGAERAAPGLRGKQRGASAEQAGDSGSGERAP